MTYQCTKFDKSSAVAEMGYRGHNRHGPKRGGLLCPFRGELCPRLTQCGLGQGLLPYQVASSSIQPFGHKRHGPKTGAVPLLGGAATTPSGILVHPAAWPQRTSAENSRGRQRPFSGGEDGSPSNTMSPRLMPTSVPSGILIHTAVWPQ